MRITPADIEASIASESYFTAADGLRGAGGGNHILAEYVTYEGSPLAQITICVLILKNGYKIVGVNEGSVDPANFDTAIGRKYAREKAVDQIWPLLGYELKTQLASGY